jgi:hypothetical protein
MKKVIVIISFILLQSGLLAQKESNLLKKHEISLLNLLLSDSINNTSFTLNNAFNFGLDNQLFTHTNIIKNGKEVFIQPLGTGRLYKAFKDKNGVGVNRIDKTIHSGVSFFSQSFFIKDTLYQYGGLGFWQIRGTICYYSTQTNQWELVQTSRAVQSFFDEQKDAIMHFDDKRPDPKLYVSNSYYYPNYPSSFESLQTDSSYVYDFNTRKWLTLGKNTNDFKKIMENKHAHLVEIRNNNLFIFQNQLEFYWLNYEKNEWGLFNPKENNRLRQFWLSVYNNNKSRLQTEFQFNLGNDLYFMKLDTGADLEWVKTKIDMSALDTVNTFNIYNNQPTVLETISQLYNKYKTKLFILLSVVLMILGIRSNLFKKKNIPKEVVTILYQNFFNSLNIIEKEIIEALYQSNLKGEEVSTKTINKIIGVQQKDTLSQNKSRSDHFIKINQKFKMATQNTELLIVKNRDKIDKRQYNYRLNELYISAIEKIFKD